MPIAVNALRTQREKGIAYWGYETCSGSPKSSKADPLYGVLVLSDREVGAVKVIVCLKYGQMLSNL
jgi:hypothetical protein